MGQMLSDAFDTVVGWFNNILWGSSDYPMVFQAGILGVVLIGAGVFFTIRLHAVQFVRFPKLFSVFGRGLRPSHEGAISPFAAFATSMAARVGAGNIAGVALAITLGGPGAIFWMWVVALLGMATAMIEATLAQIYKQRDLVEGKYIFRGGPAYYISKGLNSKPMAVLFAICLLLAFPLLFNAVQANTVTSALANSFGMERWISGVVIAALAAAIIFGGIKRIAGFAQLVVPFMALGYLLMGLTVMVLNLTELPGMFADIARSAFGPQEVVGGFAGYALSAALVQGIKRGLFSNEAGLGSAPNAAATADTKHPANQGFIQALGVFVDTIVVCTTTASIVLLGGVWQPGDSAADGATLTQDSAANIVGDWGAQYIAIALVFFAFTSIAANYYYGETTVLFLRGDHRILLPLRILVIVMVLWGSVAESPSVWAAADVGLGLMALVNLIALVLLAKYVVPVIRDYVRQLRTTDEPVFNMHDFPELEGHVEPDVWGSPAEQGPFSDARDPSI